MRSLIAALLLLAGTPAGAQDVAAILTSQADGTRTLEHTIVVPASIEAVWEALSTPEGWRSWAVPLVRPVSGSGDRFETSYDPQAAPGSASTIEQQWVARDFPRRVAFKTTRTPKGFPYAEAYLQVTSTFLLEPAGKAAAKVRLVGTGYPPGPDGDALIAFFRQGNRLSLQQLHRRFTSGPIDWSQARSEEKK